jgi:hypothetical protein
MYGWREYFPNARIFGLDVDPAYIFQDHRISTHIVDCNDGSLLRSFANDWGPFDLIVDDGPHDPRAQITALLNLWQFVAPGGYYVIEDILADQYFNIMNYYSYFPGNVHDFRHISNIRNDVMLTLAKGEWWLVLPVASRSMLVTARLWVLLASPAISLRLQLILRQLRQLGVFSIPRCVQILPVVRAKPATTKMTVTAAEKKALGTRGIDATADPDPQGGFVQTSGQIVSTQEEGWQETLLDKSPSGKFGGA